MTYQQLDQIVKEFERKYSYAVRTPFKGIGYSTDEVKCMRSQVNHELFNIEQLLGEATARDVPNPEYDRLAGTYARTQDLKRRTEQLVWDRRLYIPRKAVTYVSNVIDGMKSAWNWLMGLTAK